MTGVSTMRSQNGATMRTSRTGLDWLAASHSAPPSCEHSPARSRRCIVQSLNRSVGLVRRGPQRPRRTYSRERRRSRKTRQLNFQHSHCPPFATWRADCHVNNYTSSTRKADSGFFDRRREACGLPKANSILPAWNGKKRPMRKSFAVTRCVGSSLIVFHNPVFGRSGKAPRQPGRAAIPTRSKPGRRGVALSPSRVHATRCTWDRGAKRNVVTVERSDE